MIEIILLKTIYSLVFLDKW